MLKAVPAKRFVGAKVRETKFPLGDSLMRPALSPLWCGRATGRTLTSDSLTSPQRHLGGGGGSFGGGP